MLASPKKGETAVHCCDSAISVLVTLVSRNVFHVVSALQSIVCLIWPTPENNYYYYMSVSHKDWELPNT